MEINDELVLDVKRMGINGEGIAFYKKLAVFIDGALPGEAVKVRITSTDTKMAKAEIIEIIKPSKHRVEPDCKHYGQCKACQTMHIDYKESLKLKRDMIVDSLHRYTKLNTRSFEIKPTIGPETPYGYRNKSSLPVRKFNDKSVVGIYGDSGRVEYIDTCLIQHPLVNEVNEYVLSLIDKYNIATFNEKFKRGVVKFIVTRASTATGEVQVTLVCHEVSSKLYDLAKDLIEHPNVVSVFENVNPSNKAGIIFSDKFNLLQGKETITEIIGGYKYNLLPNAFFQLNPIQTNVLYDLIKKACKLSRTETVLDLYCGVGSISIHVSKLAKEVVGIEYNKEAVKNATDNAKLNRINNVKFYDGDVAEVLPRLMLQGLKVDVCIVDPPRTGLGEEVIDTLITSAVKRIVYVSCNHSTMAKDLCILSESYNVKYIQPVDMFSQTSLIESIILLEKK